MDKISLTMEESRLWFEWELQSSVLYNLNIQYRLSGLVDIERLNLALSTTANLFDAFRTYFTEEDGVPYKVISLVNDFRIDVLDLTQSTLSDSSQREKFANQRRIALLNQSFDLTKPSLFRCNLIKFSPKNYYFIFVMPHILCDAYSLNLFLNLLSRIYNGGEEEKLKIESEYQLRLTEQLSDTWAEVTPSELEVESYWKSKFENALCQIEFKIFKKGSSKYSGKRIWLPLPTDLISGLKKLATAEHTTLFNILAASISIFLYCYFEQEDICLYYPVNTRPKNKYSNQLFGFYVNELGLRTKLSKKLIFREVLAHIVQQRLMDKKYQSYPLIEALLAKLRMDNPTLEFPFNVGLVKTSFFKWREDALKDISIQPFDSFDYDGVINDLLFLYEEITEDNKYQLAFSVYYNTSIFDTVFMQRMVSHLTTLLENIIANPDERIDKLSLLTEKERHQLLVEWNQTEAWYPHDKTIHELFEAQVEQSPDAIALVFEGEELTYCELNARANQLGHYLRNLGVDLEDLIAICLERSFEMVIGILGILKAGGAYVPLDPEYPEERLRFMLEDTQANVLVTHSSVANKFVAYEGQVISWDHEKLQIAQQSKANLSNLISLKNLAYVIYTSGSTGKPKGVMVEQRAVVNMVYVHIKEFTIKPEDIILQFARFIFDASLPELLGTLLAGARVCLIPQTVKLIGDNLLDVLKRESITIVTVTPSALETIPFNTALPALRLLVVAGEASAEVTIKKWSQHYQMMNVYGPTETTVCASFEKIDLNKRKLSIGKPIANTKVYVLDQSRNPVPIGVAGKLYIGGVGLARGYLNREELTKERFIENPFSSEEDKRLGKNLRLYRSGDLVRYLADGNIEYIGRIDHQVKLRGYRIELGEIETLLRQQSEIKEAAVIPREDILGQKSLVAYVVLQDKLLGEIEEATWVNDLHQRVEQQLPEYMLPSAIMLLEQLPLTPNGKLDRRALPIPDKQYRTESYVAPRTEIERQLASIWSELLNVSPISIHDNFFRVGGHSLLAVRLVRLIEKKLAKTISLANVFKYPVIKDLAAFLYDKYEVLPNDLLPIQLKGKLPALFLVHPAAGLATPYFSLLLDNREQPIYGINNPTLNRDKECFTSIEEMAITYVDIVQAVQKTGPYRLGGWSFGGNVALEMARQFQFRGETVEIVILMDSDTDFKESRVKEDKFLEKIVLDIKQSAREKEIIRKEFDNATKMLRKYKIKPYEQRVILLKATKNKKNQLCNGWEVFLPQLEVYSVCGQHFDLLYGESAQEISVKLNEILSKPKPAIFELQKLSLFERIALGAAARNDAFLVKLSLEKIEDFNINVQDHLERTLLHWAVSYGNSELFDFLLRYDPQVNISDKKGNTPIMLAENQDYTEIGYRELNIAQQLEKMGYAHYKTEIEAKLKAQKERINIYNKLKKYATEIM